MLDPVTTSLPLGGRDAVAEALPPSSEQDASNKSEERRVARAAKTMNLHIELTSLNDIRSSLG